MSESLNGDLSRRAVENVGRMAWTPSPSGTVWRKRLHLVGPPEAGQVTSVVRYEPDSSFPAHDHPGGEEILVLEGLFSDEHGDWPKGSYLLNPEGFRHAPFSKPGCLLLVKLRQYPGRDRRHVALDTDALPWTPAATPGVSSKRLYRQEGFHDETALERWEPGTEQGEVRYPTGVEFYVLTGEFSDEAGSYPAGSWLRLPAGTAHRPRTAGGCELYVKTGGFPYLDSSRG
ncbi:MAG: cupin domain-containing protein [Woeseiaceae bacterium]|nr:cupin domain-containing protein [Woeseiaceae bacterium]